MIKIKAGKGTGKVYDTHAYHANIERKPEYVNIIQNLQTTNEIKLDCRLRLGEGDVRQPCSNNRITHYVGAVSGVNKDLVVGVGLSLHLLGAVGSRGLTFAAATKDKTRVTIKTAPSPQITAATDVCLVRPAAGDKSFTCQTREG